MPDLKTRWSSQPLDLFLSLIKILKEIENRK